MLEKDGNKGTIITFLVALLMLSVGFGISQVAVVGTVSQHSVLIEANHRAATQEIGRMDERFNGILLLLNTLAEQNRELVAQNRELVSQNQELVKIIREM